jgi:acyl-coenzyme A synthetase/AMP-(fatty) acid ligase
MNESSLLHELAGPPQAGHRVIDTDICAILYTSGSTGRPRAWC